MPAQVIEQLTDDDVIGEINTEIVNEAIAAAQETIDGFVRGRYPADMDDDDVPEQITDICTKLTAYNLYRRTLAETLPEPIRIDYKYCMSQLKLIQEGKINPWPVASEPVIFKTNKTSSDRIYTSTVWAGY